MVALGRLEEERGRARRAAEWYERALVRDPHSASLHAALGRICAGPLGDVDRALPHLRLALQLEPSGPDAEAIRQQLQTARQRGAATR